MGAGKFAGIVVIAAMATQSMGCKKEGATVPCGLITEVGDSVSVAKFEYSSGHVSRIDKINLKKSTGIAIAIERDGEGRVVRIRAAKEIQLVGSLDWGSLALIQPATDEADLEFEWTATYTPNDEKWVQPPDSATGFEIAYDDRDRPSRFRFSTESFVLMPPWPQFPLGWAVLPAFAQSIRPKSLITRTELAVAVEYDASGNAIRRAGSDGHSAVSTYVAVPPDGRRDLDMVTTESGLVVEYFTYDQLGRQRTRTWTGSDGPSVRQTFHYTCNETTDWLLEKRGLLANDWLSPEVRTVVEAEERAAGRLPPLERVAANPAESPTVEPDSGPTPSADDATEAGHIEMSFGEQECCSKNGGAAGRDGGCVGGDEQGYISCMSYLALLSAVCSQPDSDGCDECPTFARNRGDEGRFKPTGSVGARLLSSASPQKDRIVEFSGCGTTSWLVFLLRGSEGWTRVGAFEGFELKDCEVESGPIADSLSCNRGDSVQSFVLRDGAVTQVAGHTATAKSAPNAVSPPLTHVSVPATSKRKRKPRMSKGTPVVGDYCDPGNVRRVIGGKSNAIKYCYEKELQTNPNMEGKIVAQWEVGLHGSVVDASISTTTMSSKAVEGCIIRVVKRMRFDKPKGGSCTVSFPFVFAAE